MTPMTTMEGQRQREYQQQQHPHDLQDRDEAQEARLLYEQVQSKTVLFTSAISSHLHQFNGKDSARTGLYQCTLEPDNNFDDFNDGDESREVCHVASKLADKINFRFSAELELRHLQFDLSSLRSGSNTENPGKKNYLYANTHGNYERDHKPGREPDWEIVRAELPQVGDYDSDVLRDDGTLSFESVFRTVEEIEWNECDFDCCFQYDKILNEWEKAKFRSAYVRAVIRSYVVDEHTGDIFIAWEGFYKDCGNVFGGNEKLEWTLGVSRLKVEDPSCVFLDEANKSYLDESHFPRCTEPVSIVYQSTRGREVAMSYGGFAVIPASSTGSKRSFLLTVLSSPGIDSGELTSRVWAFPEGENAIEDGYERQDITGTGTVVDSIFMDQNVWDGGSLRLNYDPTTGKPNHLCRTILEEGIECIPISVTTRDGIPVVESTGEAQTFLSKEQTGAFCRLADADETNRLHWSRKTTMVTGLDVQWNSLTGEPQRIFFGCWGGEGGNGNFGSVEKNGNSLMRVMEGAYANSVLFLPQELEGTIDPRTTPPTDHPRPCVVEARAAALAAEEGSSYNAAPNNKTLGSNSLAGMMALAVVALCLAIYKRRRRRQRHAPDELRTEIGFRTQYVELQNLDDGSPPTSPVASPPTEEEVNFVL